MQSCPNFLFTVVVNCVDCCCCSCAVGFVLHAAASVLVVGAFCHVCDAGAVGTTVAVSPLVIWTQCIKSFTIFAAAACLVAVVIFVHVSRML